MGVLSEEWWSENWTTVVGFFVFLFVGFHAIKLIGYSFDGGHIVESCENGEFAHYEGFPENVVEKPGGVTEFCSCVLRKSNEYYSVGDMLSETDDLSAFSNWNIEEDEKYVYSLNRRKSIVTAIDYCSH